MAVVSSTKIPFRNQRRSKRVLHKTAIVVRFQDANKQSVTEETNTILVSDHGALILLATSVTPQQIIRVEHVTLGEELLCRVVNLGPTLMGKTQVAVEFIVPKPGFWTVSPKH